VQFELGGHETIHASSLSHCQQDLASGDTGGFCFRGALPVGSGAFLPGLKRGASCAGLCE
jgi:hypothetical protein